MDIPKDILIPIRIGNTVVLSKDRILVLVPKRPFVKTTMIRNTQTGSARAFFSVPVRWALLADFPTRPGECLPVPR